MSEEDWVKAAMTDDSIVVELLVRLNHHATCTRPPSSKPVCPLYWSVRRPRRSNPVVLTSKKSSTASASPTTPLSWSGGTSLSGCGGGGTGGASGGGAGADCFEESSRPPPKRSDASRSKVMGMGETATPKRSRKKKTLAELKEEEMLLLKKRRHLEMELATLRVTLEKQRATNESLKRMKVGLEPQMAREERKSGQMLRLITATDHPVSTNFQTCGSNDNEASPQLPQQISPEVQEEGVTDKEPSFVLPDLNLPLEDNSCS